MHANHVELAVVLVFPESGVAEVGVIDELSAALGPPHRLGFCVPVNNRRVYKHSHS